MAKPDVIIADYLYHNTHWDFEVCVIRGKQLWESVQEKCDVELSSARDAEIAQLRSKISKLSKSTFENKPRKGNRKTG